MFEIDENFEDITVTKISIEEYIKKFEPEIQQIFYDYYGENLENIPKEVPKHRIEDMLESLLELKNIKYQKVILMRFGFITGTPMTLQEVADEFEITRERARQIESKVLRRRRPIRRKKLIDIK